MTLTDLEGDIIAWGQHDIRINPENDSYYLFDNGLGRFFGGEIKYSRGIKFKIDPEVGKYEIVQSFGENRTELYSPITSGIDFDNTGSVLVNFGSVGYGITYDAESRSLKCANENGCFKDIYHGYGATWIEYDDQNDVLTEIFISYPDGSGKDSGTYRARFGNLSI